jgi:hypothetical protein
MPALRLAIIEALSTKILKKHKKRSRKRRGDQHLHIKCKLSDPIGRRGQVLEFSLLMTHAQDSLMVTLSEINMAKMLKLYKKLYS